MNDAAASPVAAGLAHVRQQIVAAAAAAARDPAEIALVAVSKMHPPERMLDAIAAGQRRFGENRVQEAQAKWPAIKARHPDIVLHLIGPLQTNKIRQAVGLFDVIESVDRDALAQRLKAEMDKVGRQLACYVEINTGAEPQKAGIAPGEAEAFIARCRTQYALAIEGLMCVPPHGAPPAPHFALLRTIAQRCGIARLSMGMSEDFPIAIREGATELRIGTAIFGARA
jgi:pyridoxal phosphate enzyme (YggS family)